MTHDYTYDVRGNILTSTHDGETLLYAYDAIGRVVSQSHNGGTTVAYEWDAANNLTKLTWPDGFDVDYEWDANNRVTAAKDGARTLASVAYDPLSRRASVSYDNGASVSYGYTDRGDLTDHDLAFAGAAAANYDYAYNGVGQLVSRAVSDPSFSWLPLASGTDAYAVNGLNQYTSIAGATPVYDGNGNLTTDHNGRSFTYDAENVLRSASGLASGSATYRYHADGSRREKTAQDATTQFYYMGGLGYLDEEDTAFAADQEIAEYSGATLLRRYIRLPGSVDETFLMIDFTSNPSGDEIWAHQDRLGSVVAISNDAGTILEKYRYSPYGVSGWEGEGGFPFRFTGQKLDPETGFYYYKARYYDPEVGRFLQTDPIGYEDQMNLYAYVANDPINLKDPTGMCPVCIPAGIALARAAYVGYRGYRAYRLARAAAMATAAAAIVKMGIDSVTEGGTTVRGHGRGVSGEEYYKGKGWTGEQIDDAVNNPEREYASKNGDTSTGGEEGATVKVDKDGNWVVVNDKTGKVIAVNDRNNPKQKPPEEKPREEPDNKSD